MVSGDTSGLAPFSASQELAMMRGSDQSYAMSDEIDKSDGWLCDTQGNWPPHPEEMESQKRRRFLNPCMRCILAVMPSLKSGKS